MAQLSYSAWEQADAEDMAAFCSRRRTVDLALLARQVINEELLPTERLTLCLHYDEGLEVREIATKLQINKSGVSRTLKRAEERVRRYLKYVVRYQQDQVNDATLPLVVREALVVSAARHRVTDFSARLSDLRKAENMKIEDVAPIVGLTPFRLREIENARAVPDALELLRLSAFYGVTVDSILRGEYGQHRIEDKKGGSRNG